MTHDAWSNMKILSLTFLFILLPGAIYGQPGQSPSIGIIDFYGLRSVSEQAARQALQIKVGDSLPNLPNEWWELSEAAQRRLEALPNVRQAMLSPVCCEAGQTILFVGISENGAPALPFRPAPRGRIRLPGSMVQAGDSLMDALGKAVLKGDRGEDRSQGHALNSNSEMRAIQERYITFVAQHVKQLRAVLRQSADAQHRALAAQIIAYAPNKRDVVKDLVYGMSDPDSNVRNNSMRALIVIAEFAQQSPQHQIKVPIEPFIAMLNSIVWTDRNKSSGALHQLTQKRNPAVLSKLREHALPSLIEMSRWKNPGHALASFFLLGRVGNLSEEEIKKDWDSGHRETLIEKVLKRITSK